MKDPRPPARWRSPSPSPLLEVRDLAVRFRTDDGVVQAVYDMSLQLEHGDVVALVGESGCGKSVTALSLVGLLPSSADVSGTVLFDGVDLRRLSAARMREIRGSQIAFVFQEPMTSLNPVFTVGRQIAEVLRRHRRCSRAEARERAIELLDMVGIPVADRRAGEYPHQLSGGMRQRVMIAMAIACEPKILIADEPTTALDVTIQAAILDLLRDLRDRLGMAVLLITHDLGVVADMADRVVVMYAGRRVEEAPAGDVFARPQHPYTIGLLGAVPDPGNVPPAGHSERLKEIPGLVPTLHAPADHCVFAPRCPRQTVQCTEQLPAFAEQWPGHRTACFHPTARAGAA
jgi:peptide/nickel transport system ATP-binding protein